MSIKELLQGKSAIRGRSTAFVVTVAVHVVFFLVAGVYVALEVFKEEEPRFEGEQLSRPKMQIKKLKVPIKVTKITQPKMQQMAAPTQVTKMDVDMPTMGGVGGGTGSFGGAGTGFSLGFNFDTVFGGDTGDLEGTLYDLKQTADGDPIRNVTDKTYQSVIRSFLRSWNERELQQYYQAPKKKYAIAFSMPAMSASAAPQAFEVQDIVEPKYWAIHYKGKIEVRETGRYRFCGLGDDVLAVRVDGDLVLDAAWPKHRQTMTDWKSSSPESDRFPLGGATMVVGDWVRLRRGTKIPFEVLIGEIGGGLFSCHLFVEQEGEDYKTVKVDSGQGGGMSYPGGTRKILPIFKMTDIPSALIPKMKISSKECTIEGPVFGAGN
jgi:hypothetical protein